MTKPKRENHVLSPAELVEAVRMARGLLHDTLSDSKLGIVLRAFIAFAAEHTHGAIKPRPTPRVSEKVPDVLCLRNTAAEILGTYPGGVLSLWDQKVFTVAQAVMDLTDLQPLTPAMCAEANLRRNPGGTTYFSETGAVSVDFGEAPVVFDVADPRVGLLHLARIFMNLPAGAAGTETTDATTTAPEAEAPCEGHVEEV